MPGLRSRILSRRADGAPPTAPAAPDAAPGEPATPSSPAATATAGPPAEQPTAIAPAVAEQPTAITPAVVAGDPVSMPEVASEVVPVEAAPEEVAPEEVVPPRASFRARGQLRRRLRYLRRVRELGFRDLGGLVFDLDRFGRERPDLLELKLAGLRSIDAELRALESALADERPVEELSEPGISACAHCGALHGSEARFCPVCGTAVGAPVAVNDAPGEPGAAATTSPDQPAP